jgi:cysteine dioxygenase
MTPTAITRLQGDLIDDFRRDPRGPSAARILGAYAAAHDDWRRFVHFDPAVYTRNLVGRNEHFEMLVLCWNAGQESPIHNHAGQHCWMAVLEGEVEEIQFTPPTGERQGCLRNGPSRIYKPGKVAYINDDIALHRVRPAPGSRGVSLHLYSKPIDVCNVYDEQTGRVVPSRMVYHSIEGVITGASSPGREAGRSIPRA